MSIRDSCSAPHPRQLKNGFVAWRGQTDLQVIGIYNTAYPVQDKPVDHLTFETTGNGGIWLVAGVTFADHRVPVAEKEPVVLTAGKEWRVIPYHPAVKGSIVDFSDQLDAPAGKYGFVKAAGNNFEFEKRPGVPVRFNGGNIALNVNFMNREDTDLLADQMAKVGYNFVRLHHFDNGLVLKDARSSTTLNRVMIDRLDYLVSAMKKRGIYITLDLFMSRELVKGEIPDFPDVKFGLNFKLAPYVSEAAMQNWMTFSRNLMTHVNPYTGTAWKDEPAIVTISLINENNIFKVASDPVLGPVYRKKFAEHVKTKGLRLSKENREREWMLFLMETYGKNYRRMAKFLKEEIGVKALLTDQNHLSNIPRTFMRNDFDLVDQHLYWEHPRFLIPGRAAEPFSAGNISLTSPTEAGRFLTASSANRSPSRNSTCRIPANTPQKARSSWEPTAAFRNGEDSAASLSLTHPNASPVRPCASTASMRGKLQWRNLPTA